MTTPPIKYHLIDKPARRYILFFIPADWVMLPEDGEAVEINNSFISSLFLLLNTMIGSGVLVQPYVFSQAGVVSVPIEYIIIGMLNFSSIQILLLCAHKLDVFDYSGVAETTLGRTGQIIVDMCLVIGGSGSLLSYVLIIGSLLKAVVLDFCSCSEWYCNIGFLTAVPIVLFTIPLCLIRNYGHLAGISYLSIFVVGSSILLVIIVGPIERILHDDYDGALNLGSWHGSLSTTGDIVFALGFIGTMFHAYKGMATQTPEEFSKLSFVTIVLGVALCFTTGLVGYLSFRDEVETNVLENFSGGLAASFQIALIIHLILYIPGDFVVVRAALFKLLDIDVLTQSDFSFITMTLAFMFFVTFLAVMLQLYMTGDSLALVVDLTGGIAGSMLYFVIPAACGMTLFKEDKRIYYRSLGLGVFGILLVFSVIFAII